MTIKLHLDDSEGVGGEKVILRFQTTSQILTSGSFIPKFQVSVYTSRIEWRKGQRWT